MATITRMKVQAEITSLMKSYLENPYVDRTLNLSSYIEVYKDHRTFYGYIIGITIIQTSEIPLLKIGYPSLSGKKSFIDNYTLFSMGNFDEETLKRVLHNAKESMASAGK